MAVVLVTDNDRYGLGEQAITALIMLLILAITLLGLWHAHRIFRIIGETGSQVAIKGNGHHFVLPGGGNGGKRAERAARLFQWGVTSKMAFQRKGLRHDPLRPHRPRLKAFPALPGVRGGKRRQDRPHPCPGPRACIFGQKVLVSTTTKSTPPLQGREICALWRRPPPTPPGSPGLCGRDGLLPCPPPDFKRQAGGAFAGGAFALAREDGLWVLVEADGSARCR